MSTLLASDALRATTARRGKQLEVLTVIWGSLEAAIALTAAYREHSISLTGFGLDSVIEVISAVALLWRMSQEMNHHRRHHAERISLRVAGICLLALGVYVAADACYGLWKGHIAETGWLGIGVTTAALVCMPLLANAKRKVGRALASSAMMTDARQSDFCMYQAAIVLFGLIVHAITGVTWVDSAAALLLVPFLFRAGVLSLQGKQCCSH